MIVTIVMILANLFSNDEIKIKQIYKWQREQRLKNGSKRSKT